MPELPEVETIKLGLRKYLIGRTIEDIEVRIPKIFVGSEKQIIGAKIVDIKRIGKSLIIELDNDFVLAVHLKMTGQLVYSDNSTKRLILSEKVGGATLPSKYTHIILKLKSQISNLKTTTQNSKPKSESKDAYLYYNDLRRFGWIKVIKKDELMQIPFFKEMGPEPKVGKDLVGKELTFDYFKTIIEKGNLPVKLILMDQKRIGGIGNIYANDALFKAKIDPRRKGKTLSEEEVRILYNSIFYVLKKSLGYGGSSDENFVNALGQEGNYQNHTLVYGKEGEKCPCSPRGEAGEGIIQKIKLGGRGTYFCAKCQH
jgi:formamidopyrimidine-DNA glycosylase